VKRKEAIPIFSHTSIEMARNDEEKYGEYCTKRVILKCYNAMAEAVKTGRPYQTILDPLPTDPKAAHLSKDRP